MKSNLEIERRWLMRKLPNVLADECYTVIQYYTPEGRFRCMSSYSETQDKHFIPKVRYYHTIKKIISYGVNDEQENEISEVKYKAAILKADKVIRKLRFIHKHQGLKFEIDFMNDITYHDKFHCDLIILEVELNDINQKFDIPYFIENRIIKEITGDASYSNFNLAQEL